MKDRTFIRTQGCWNCIHSSDARQWWLERRETDLQRGLTIAIESPHGENDPKVLNIRRMVATADYHVARRELIRCTRGIMANGQPVGDLTASNYLCHKWTAAEGASIARAGQRADKLPEELADDLDGGKPTSVTRLVDDYNDKGIN